MQYYVGLFLRPFSGNEAHRVFFLVTQIGVFWVGSKELMLKQFICFFCPLKVADSRAGSRKRGTSLNSGCFLWKTTESSQKLPERNYIRPPPLPAILAKRHFSGEGGGVYILRPHAAGILYPPQGVLYTPPIPRRVVSGVGGWGCIKFGPIKLFS